MQEPTITVPAIATLAELLTVANVETAIITPSIMYANGAEVVFDGDEWHVRDTDGVELRTQSIVSVFSYLTR